jgi:Zn-dependent peptidase ImmA (M78 family)
MSAANLQEALYGARGLTFNQLRNIANYFGKGVLFFMEEGDVDESSVRTPQFRTLEHQKPNIPHTVKAIIEQVERQRSIYLNLLEELEEPTKLFLPPNISPSNAVVAAAIAREWLELEEENDFESYRLAIERRGILVFRSNGYAGKWQIPKTSSIEGFSIYQECYPTIFIRKQISESRQSFTLMHELGHLLLHKTSSIDDDLDMSSYKGKERLANIFAGNLLVPTSFLGQIALNRKPSDIHGYEEWLKPQCRKWGVSTEMLLRRLLDEGRLSEKDYVKYREWSEKRQLNRVDSGVRTYRYREPKHLFGDGYVRAVLGALTAGHITLNKASTYLDNLKITDLHQLERHYAGL